MLVVDCLFFIWALDSSLSLNLDRSAQIFLGKIMEQRPTVGKLSWDLLQHASPADHSAEEQMREQLDNYERNVFEAVENGKKLYGGDFYIVVETKKEPKMKNVIRNYFFPRMTCPTPTYDNSVYKYHRSEEHLQFLWVLPSKEVCKMMREYALEIPSEERELLQFVLDDADGTLLRRCKQLNGERV